MPPISRAWRIRLPDLDDDVEPLTKLPFVDQTDPVMHEFRVRGLRITPEKALPDMEIRDVELRECDVAGLISEGGRVASLHLLETRLRGVTWVRGFFEDLMWENGVGTEVSFRFSKLRRAIFRDCKLPGLDLTEVEFDRVRFERCDLRGAKFDHARVTQLRIEQCQLEGASGIESLRGASIHPDDVLGIAYALASSVGIKVEEESS